MRLTLHQDESTPESRFERESWMGAIEFLHSLGRPETVTATDELLSRNAA